MEFYCHNCETPQYHDDLKKHDELMDPSVPGSWQSWYVCGHCGSEEIQEMDAQGWYELFDETIKDLRRTRRDLGAIDRAIVGDADAELMSIERRLDLIIEYLEAI